MKEKEKCIFVADLNDNVDNQEIANSSLFNAHIGIVYLNYFVVFIFSLYILYLSWIVYSTYIVCFTCTLKICCIIFYQSFYIIRYCNKSFCSFFVIYIFSIYCLTYFLI